MSNEKSAIEQLREKIAVENTNDDQNQQNEPEANESDESSDEDIDDDSNESDEAEGSDELNNAEDDIEESENEEEKLKKEKREAKTQREKERIQRKIDREVAKRKVLEEEVASLKAQLDAKNAEGDKLTEEDVKTEAKKLADAALAEKEFNDTCNKLAEEGENLKDKDGKPLGKAFITKLNTMASEIGPIPHDVIYILGDLDNGAEILNYLADEDNIDEAEKIYSMPPARKAISLTKISNKLSDAKKTVKPISKVPAPNKTINSRSTGAKQLSDSMSTEEWIATRNAQLAEKRASRGY